MNRNAHVKTGWFIDDEDIVIPQGAHVIYQDKTTLQSNVLHQHYNRGWRNSLTYPDLIFLIITKKVS
jgi:hypothetical protein